MVVFGKARTLDRMRRFLEFQKQEAQRQAHQPKKP